MSNNDLSQKNLTFSQVWDYEKLPGPLKPEKISQEARTRLWNNLYDAVRHCLTPYGYYVNCITLPPWHDILHDLHAYFFNFELDRWDNDFKVFIKNYKNFIYASKFNEIFDLLQYIMRHSQCPSKFINDVAETFKQCQLAYIVCKEFPVTIFPATTKTEGKAILETLKRLHDNEFLGAETHLQKAADFMNQGEYADSIRESINSVESVARKLNSKPSNSLDKSLKVLDGEIHPALKRGLLALYGYTSDEKGIRHSLIDEGQANVGIDEAVFMLGACASFASYLLRKHKTEFPQHVI